MAPRHLLDTADPVAAFAAARRAGELVALPTSGTSGTARTVVRTTASWVDSFAAVSELAGLGDTARVWIPGPLTATMNLFAAVHADAVGAVRAPTLAGATHAQLTPWGLRRLLDEDGDLQGRTVVVAGDALAPELRRRAEAAGARVGHYYGAAELSFVGWGTDATTLRPFPGVDVDLRDGELWVRSPFVCRYVQGAPGPFRRAGDDFATVGDRGRLDDQTLVVTGRGDAVITGGATVLIADVEAALRPALTGHVVVLGLPHPRLGAVVVAVLTDDADRPAAVAAAAALGPGRPRRWLRRPELPLTAAGKVDRRALASELGAVAG